MAQFDSGSGGSGTDTTEESTEPETDATQTSPGETTATLDGGGDTTTQPPETGGPQTGPGPGSGGPQTASGGPTQTTATGTGTGGADTEPAPDRGDPVDPGDQPDVARDLAQQLGSQLERDVSPDQLDIRRVETDDGTRFVARPGGRLRAAMSREQARQTGVNIGARGERAELLAQLRSGGPALESGRVEVSTDTIREAEQQAQPPGSQGVDVEAVERVGQARQAVESARQAAAARLSGAAAAASAQGNRQRQLEQQTDELTSFVEGVEDTLGFDPVPGEGPVVDEQALDQDFGQFGGQLGRDVESGLQDLQTDIFEATELGEPGAFAEQFGPEAEAAVERQREEGFTRDERQRQAFAGGGSKAIARTPAFLVGGGLLAKDTLDLGADISDEIARGDAEAFQATVEGLGTAGATTGALAASQAIEEPFETAGAAAGSLLGTGVLFGAASAAGRVPSLATRLAIQPGEEIVGFGGNRLTRAVAGERRAQQLFPNNEPLIFSEEAAIRAGRRANQRVRQELGLDAESRTPAGLGFRSAAVETGEFDTTVAADTESLLDRLRQEFTGEDRGQVSMGLPGRGRATEPEITQDDIARPSPRGAPGGPETGRGRSRRETFRENVQARERRRRQRQRRGQEPSIDTETGLEARQRIESALELSGLGFDETGLLATDTLQSTLERPDQRVDRLSDARIDTELDTGFESLQDTRSDTDTRQELGLRSETETEPQTASESASEIERELALENRLETRGELEFEIFNEPDAGDFRGGITDFSGQSEVFESGIADITTEDIDELFGGDDRNDRDPLAGLEGNAPDALGGGLDDLAEEFDQAFNGDNQ